LPWISNFQNLDGNQYFCCYSKTPIDDVNSDQTKSIRNDIWDGRQVPHCQTCYDSEKRGLISPRQKDSVLWLKDVEVSKHFLSSSSSPEHIPLFVDLRMDNTCNLACISCNPKDSSLWAKELGIKNKRVNNISDIESIYSAKRIYMAGGEPLIIKEYLDIIKKISEVNPSIELVINTNLTSFPPNLISQLEKIEKCSLIVSIDSYGKVNDYHRYPSKFDKLIKNLDIIKNTSNIHIDINTVVDAVSVFGFKDMYRLDPYADHWNLSILQGPKELQIKNISNRLKDHAQEQIEGLKNSKFYLNDIKFKRSIDVMLKELYTDGSSESLKNFINVIDKRRNINHYEYLGVNLLEN
jgi:sulfatase maturation enzyme AslB (radical SAM superfamily)